MLNLLGEKWNSNVVFSFRQGQTVIQFFLQSPLRLLANGLVEGLLKGRQWHESFTLFFGFSRCWCDWPAPFPNLPAWLYGQASLHIHGKWLFGRNGNLGSRVQRASWLEMLQHWHDLNWLDASACDIFTLALTCDSCKCDHVIANAKESERWRRQEVGGQSNSSGNLQWSGIRRAFEHWNASLPSDSEVIASTRLVRVQMPWCLCVVCSNSDDRPVIIHGLRLNWQYTTDLWRHPLHGCLFISGHCSGSNVDATR